MTDTLLPKNDRSPSSQSRAGEHNWLFDGDDPYIICSWCKQTRDAITGNLIKPNHVGLPKNDEELEMRVMDLLGQVASWGYAMKNTVSKEEFMLEWINKGAIDNQEGASVFMELVRARDTKILEQARLERDQVVMPEATKPTERIAPPAHELTNEEYNLEYCPTCNQMTNHLGVCQKCNRSVHDVDELRDKMFEKTIKTSGGGGNNYELTFYMQDLLDIFSSREQALKEQYSFDQNHHDAIKGIDDYQEFKSAEANSPERIAAWINQLSPWNLERGVQALKDRDQSIGEGAEKAGASKAATAING